MEIVKEIEAMARKAAIYHYTDGSTRRPKIYIDQLNRLEEYAKAHNLTVMEIFCDKSIKRSERFEFDRFLSCASQFDVLIVKDFFHISKNTMKCMEIMTKLKNKGVQIYTLENGRFNWDYTAPFEDSHKIATYCCHFGISDESKDYIYIDNDVLKLFTAKKTNWTILDQFFDESEYKNDSKKDQLKKLLNNKEKYDLLMVHSLNDIHWRTAKFCKIRNQLKLDIYSLQEGFLKYEEVSI